MLARPITPVIRRPPTRRPALAARRPRVAFLSRRAATLLLCMSAGWIASVQATTESPVAVAAPYSSLATPVSMRGDPSTPERPRIECQLKVVLVAPEVDRGAMEKRLAGPLPGEFAPILELFGADPPVDSWDAIAAAIEDGQTAKAMVGPIWIGSTEFVCLTAVTPRLDADARSITMAYSVQLIRKSDEREDRFAGAPAILDANYRRLDTAIDPMTSSTLYLFARARRLKEPKTGRAVSGPSPAAAIEADARVFRLGPELTHQDLRKRFEDPLPSDADSLRRRLSPMTRVETLNAQSVIREGQTSEGGVSTSQYAISMNLTPRLLSANQGLVLRFEMIFTPKKPKEGEPPKKIVATAYTDDNLYHLARVADDPVTSGTILIFLKGRVAEK